MQIKSILNRVQLHPGFVYGAVRWRDPRTRMVLDIEIRPRKGRHDHLFIKEADCQVITISIQSLHWGWLTLTSTL